MWAARYGVHVAYCDAVIDTKATASTTVSTRRADVDGMRRASTSSTASPASVAREVTITHHGTRVSSHPSLKPMSWGSY